MEDGFTPHQSGLCHACPPPLGWLHISAALENISNNATYRNPQFVIDMSICLVLAQIAACSPSLLANVQLIEKKWMPTNLPQSNARSRLLPMQRHYIC